MRKDLSLLFSLGCFAWGNSLLSNSVNAQVIEDGTTNTTVDANGNNFTIENGDRAGSNLFHSFQDFSVPNEGSAVFNNTADIENIFSRVTGGNVSNIDGLIQANDTNLFLINPAGILFGANSRLDIGGSFLGTTADSILFNEGEFSATDFDNPPLLTVNAPIGLNFRDRPRNITNLSVSQNLDGETNVTGGSVGLQVANGETLALIGGDILLDDGNLTAKAGHIELASILSGGQVDINQTEVDLNFDYSSINSFGDLTVQDTGIIDVSAEGGGDININAASVLLENSQINAGIFPGLGLSNVQAGDITLSATKIISLSQNSRIANNVGNFSFATGNAGNIIIDTQDLFVNDGSQIQSITFGIGNSGKIKIDANLVEFSGRNANDFPSGVFSIVNSGAEGNAGGIDIIADILNLSNRAQFLSNTDGVGNGGNINLQIANETRLLNSSILTEVSAPSQDNLGGFGIGGDINIDTGSLFLLNGSSLLADLENEGNAGNININVEDRFVLESRGLTAMPGGTNIVPTQISSTVESQAIGNGGNINIKTSSLTIKDTAFIDVTSLGQGNAGKIEITAQDIILENAAQIDAETTFGEGGNIFLNVEDDLTLKDNSFISARAFNDADGGNLTIDTNFIVAFPNGNNDIVANAQQGDGGVIDINAESLLGIKVRPLNNLTNDINADSLDGNGGIISVNTSDINPIQGATELPSNLVVPENNVAQACAASQNTSQANSLVVRGKGGVPTLPTATLSSEIITINGKPINNSNHAISTSKGNVIPARGLVKEANGNVVLTAIPIANQATRSPNIPVSCG